MLNESLNVLALDTTFIKKKVSSFFKSLLVFWIPSEWGQTRLHGFCYLYRDSRWAKAYRWYQGTGTPYGFLGVAVGIGVWKSPCSFVRVWLLSIL